MSNLSKTNQLTYLFTSISIIWCHYTIDNDTLLKGVLNRRILLFINNRQRFLVLRPSRNKPIKNKFHVSRTTGPVIRVPNWPRATRSRFEDVYRQGQKSRSNQQPIYIYIYIGSPYGLCIIHDIFIFDINNNGFLTLLNSFPKFVSFTGLVEMIKSFEEDRNRTLHLTSPFFVLPSAG